MIATKREIKRFRRYRGYDYSRGAVVFASFHLEPRQPLFGRVDGGKVVYSPAGEILVRVIEKEALRTPDAQLMKWVAMPDHVHLRIYLRPGQGEPLKRLGQFIYNVKAWSRNIAKRELGFSFEWQKNYHDWLCLSREAIEAVDKGFTLAGTWISPCERVVFAGLVKRGAAVIRASQDPLSMVYRPKGDEPGLFAKGRYLVISRPAGNPAGLAPACSGCEAAARHPEQGHAGPARHPEQGGESPPGFPPGKKELA